MRWTWSYQLPMSPTAELSVANVRIGYRPRYSIWEPHESEDKYIMPTRKRAVSTGSESPLV